MSDINVKKKREFKMPTAFTILFAIILVIVVASWILNWIGVKYNASEDVLDENGLNIWDPSTNDIMVQQVEKTVNAVGIIDMFYSVLQGFVGKADIIVFILVLGGFVLITMNTKSLEALTQSLTRKMGEKAIWLIPILVVFFSFCGSTYGMAEESLGFYLLIIPLMLSAGFDTVTGLLIVLLGAGTGVLASTVNPFVIAIAAKNSGSGDINPGDGMAWRWISWVIFTIMAIVFIMLYARKVKKDLSKSVVFSTMDADKEFFLKEAQVEIPFTKKRVATVVIFLMTFVIMVIYMVGWDSILGGTGAEAAGNWMNENIPYITSLIPGFGLGGLVEVGTFFFISALIIAVINWGGEEQYVSNMIDGARDLLGVCLVIATAAGVGVVLESSGIQILIVNGLSSSVGGLTLIPYLLVSFIIFLPLSFLIPSTSGFAAAIFPIWGPVGAGTVGAGAGSLLSFSFASGILNLFTPTSGVVMGAIGIARVPYGKLLKAIAPYVAACIVMSIILLAVGGFMPTSVFGK